MEQNELKTEQKNSNENRQSKPSQTRWLKLTIIFLTVIILSGGIFGALGFYLGGKDKNPKISVCTDNDIKKSNEILSQENPKDNYIELAKNIVERKNYSNDINCRFISFWGDVFDNNADSAKQSADEIEKLNNEGYGLSLVFNNQMSIQDMKDIANRIGQPNIPSNGAY